MKIAIFTDSYRPYTSGVVHSIETAKEELEALGHKICIFAPAYPNQPKPENNVFRFPSLPAPTNRDFTLAIPFNRRVKRILRTWQPDLIHVHSPFILGSLGARYARFFKLPLVFTFHTLYEEYVHYFPFAKNITKKATRMITRNFCNRCDLVIVPTTIIQDYLKNIGVRVPVTNIPTGIKVEEFSFRDRSWLKTYYQIPREEKILLFVGRLGQEKNIGFLLEAYLKVNREFPGSRLVLVGGGPEEKALKKRVVAAGLQDKVIFTGKIPKEEMAKYYAGADLFVFASVTETQGLVIAEAKAAGLPVVAVRAFGVTEMVQDGDDGFLTELNQKDFVAKILFLLKNDALRQKFARQARLNAETLSARNCALKLLESYQGLLKNNPPEGSS
ncbi:MAG: glycosyltransferase family 4 protein [Bacillota bacterium]